FRYLCFYFFIFFFFFFHFFLYFFFFFFSSRRRHTRLQGDWSSDVCSSDLVATILVAGILAVASAVYVFLWFVGNAQSTGLVPRTLGLWTMGNLVSFILDAIFWELLLVGIPVVVAVVGGWLLWKRLSDEEMKGY